jgi:tetratricopeptide (TPR) repeat protein
VPLLKFACTVDRSNDSQGEGTVFQPFVGRQKELDALLAAIDRREGQLLLVAGDQGTGKSALLQELCRRLAASPVPRFYLHSWLALTDTPNDKLLELMDDLLHIEDLTRRRLIWQAPGDREQWRKFLKLFSPIGEGIGALIRDERRPVRTRFLETLALVAGNLEPAGRLVLLFDPEKELHKDYPAEWLLIAQDLPEQVTVLFTQRLDDALLSSPDLSLLPNVHRIPPHPLGALSRNESDTFIRELVRQSAALADLGRPSRADELQALQAQFWERWQGYPLAMSIVARELELFPADPLGTVTRLPPKLLDLFQRQYSRVRSAVGVEGVNLLKTLAVQPAPIPFPILGAVLALEWSALEVLMAQRELRILLRSGEGGRAWLYHPRFGEFLLPHLAAGERAEWHRRSLDAYEAALETASKDTEVLMACAFHLEQGGLLADQPEKYAALAGRLGNLFAELPYANRSDNLKRAIRHYEAALRIYTEQNFPVEWAKVQHNLGTAYWRLPTGDRGANLQQAIAHFEAALRVCTERDFPVGWARTQHGLGNAYANLPTGDRRQNLARAIGYYEAALRVRTDRDFPADWAATQHNLGAAYVKLPTGDRAANLARAIAHFEAALRVYTEQDFPENWAGTQNNLGNAYAALPTGDRGANLAQAIAYFEAALRIYTERNFPVDWARTQHNLGNAYAALPTGDRGANLAQAIAHFEAALRVYTEKNFPEDWAGTQHGLGSTYWNLPTGDRGQNLAQAIAHFEAAIRGYDAAGLGTEANQLRQFLSRVR